MGRSTSRRTRHLTRRADADEGESLNRETAFLRDRRRMVTEQIASRGIRDERVLQAMREVPREAFVPEGMEEFAYEDNPLPIGAGQTISQPYIVALMIGAAELQPDDRVLEVGAGSGYAAAVMSRIAERVYAIERHESLAIQAQARLRQLGYDNVELRTGDGSAGWPEHSPYDAILVAASAPEIPPSLLDQLGLGGRLVMPTGEQHSHQFLHKLTRTDTDRYREENLGGVAFVPLIGTEGWAEQERRAGLSPATVRDRPS